MPKKDNKKPAVAKKFPLYQQIAQTLRDEIGRVYSPNTMLPPQRVLAERFSTSYVTVGNAIQELVREGLVHRTVGSGTRVCEPGGTSRGLISILTSIHDPRYVSGLFANAEAELREHRYRPVLFGGSADFEEEKQAFREIVNMPNEAGVIIYSFFHHKFNTQMAQLRRRGIPVVGVLRQIAGFDCVRVDYRMIGMLQSQHIARHGYRRILYIGHESTEYGRLEREGFCHGLDDAGVTEIDLTVEMTNAGVGDEAEAELNDQISQCVMRYLERQKPDVIAVFGDRYLPAICRVLQEYDLVPSRDVALVGSDNQNLMGYDYVTTDHSLACIGQAAARLLLDRIEGKYDGPPRAHTVLPKLVVHDGTPKTPFSPAPLENMPSEAVP